MSDIKHVEAMEYVYGPTWQMNEKSIKAYKAGWSGAIRQVIMLLGAKSPVDPELHPERAELIAELNYAIRALDMDGDSPKDTPVSPIRNAPHYLDDQVYQRAMEIGKKKEELEKERQERYRNLLRSNLGDE